MTPKQATKKMEQLKGKLAGSKEKRTRMQAEEAGWRAEITGLRNLIRQAKVQARTSNASSGGTTTARRTRRAKAGATAGAGGDESE